MIKVFLKSLCLIWSFISHAIMNTFGQMVPMNMKTGTRYSSKQPTGLITALYPGGTADEIATSGNGWNRQIK